MTIHTLERIRLGSTTLGGLLNVRYSPRYQVVRMSGGGQLEATAACVAAGEPLLTFDLLDVDGALRVLWNIGGTPRIVPHCPITSASPAVLYLQSLGDGATRGEAGTNIALRVSKGVVIPRRISGDGALARLSCELYADYDGVNDPVVVLSGASANLPGGSSGAAVLSRLMSVVSGSTVIPRIASWSVDFGISVGRPPTRHMFPHETIITRYEPRAEWTTSAVGTALLTAGVGTVAAPGDGLSLVLARYDTHGVFVFSSGALALRLRPESRWGVSRLRAGEELAACDCFAVGRGATTMASAADAPMTLAANVNVPAEPSSVTVYRAGPLSIGGAAAMQVRSVEMTVGVQLEATGPQSLFWPTALVETAREPTLRVTPHATSEYTTRHGGAYHDTSAVKWWLRAAGDDGVWLADATTAHMLISCSAAHVSPVDYGADHNRPGSGDLVITPVKTSGALLSIAAGVAIA